MAIVCTMAIVQRYNCEGLREVQELLNVVLLQFTVLRKMLSMSLLTFEAVAMGLYHVICRLFDHLSILPHDFIMLCLTLLYILSL